MMLLIPLLLAAAPSLEPVTAFPRVQPRELQTPSGTDQAWLAVDGDLATSFALELPGEKDGATFSWVGPTAEGATAAHVFVRADCTGRARHVRLSQAPPRYRRRGLGMMLAFERPEPRPAGKAGATPPQELADTSQWQELVLPLASPRELRLSLQVLDAWPGAKGGATACVSELRVYLEGGTVNAGEEQLATEHIRRTIAERLGPRPVSRLAAAYQRTPLPTVEPVDRPKTELALQAPPDAAALLKQATALARRGNALPSLPAKLQAQGYSRAALASVLADDASTERTGETSTALDGVAGLLCADDFKLVAATNPLDGFKARYARLAKLGESLACEQQCQPLFATVESSVSQARSDCAALCGSLEREYTRSRTRDDLAGSGVFFKGPVGAPDEVVLLTSRFGGEREEYRRVYKQLMVYEGGRLKATVGADSEGYGAEVHLARWNEDRSAVEVFDNFNFYLEDGRLKLDSAERRQAQSEHASR